MKINHQNIWFTSDTHFGHKNIIKYDQEPFSSIEERDETIKNNWNSKVLPSDFVFHLGDFCFDRRNVGRLISELNGNFVFIKGNHEKPLCDYLRSNRLQIHSYLEIKVKDSDTPKGYQDICLFHYPIFEWNKGHHGAWHLYGHTHGNSEYDKTFAKTHKCKNVGIKCCNYSPVSYEEVKKEMGDKLIITHH